MLSPACCSGRAGLLAIWLRKLPRSGRNLIQKRLSATPRQAAVGDTGAVALQKQVITAGDADRSYLVAGPPPGAPISAVIMSLHGTRSTADRQARLSGFGQLARTASAVVVFPQAIEPIGTGYEWDPSQDVGYIAGLAAELLSLTGLQPAPASSLASTRPPRS
jgi:poly(3-hydroxybutyrate) depolymerase